MTAEVPKNACLPEHISFAFPPWAEKNEGGLTVLKIPIYTFPPAIVAEILHTGPVQVGAFANFTVLAVSKGAYPIRLLTATAETVFASKLSPEESLPVTIGSESPLSLRFSIRVPDYAEPSQYAVGFNFEISPLTTQGWGTSRRVDYSVNFTVVAITTSEATLEAEPYSLGSIEGPVFDLLMNLYRSFESSWPAWGLASIVLVAAIVMFYRRRRRTLA
jgi:hypothetical protein